MNTYTGPITCSSPCWPHELTQHSCEVSISQQPILIRGSKRGVTSANPYSCHDSHPVFFPIFFFFYTEEEHRQMEIYRMCTVKQKSWASTSTGLFLTLFWVGSWCLAFWKIERPPQGNGLESALLQQSWGISFFRDVKRWGTSLTASPFLSDGA